MDANNKNNNNNNNGKGVNFFFFERKVTSEKTIIHSRKSDSFDFSKLQNVKEVLEIEVKDSEQKAKQFLDWLLFPAMNTNEFLSHFFEK